MAKKNYIVIGTVLLIIVAAFLRLYNLSGFITFLGDQGRDAIIVKRIITFEHFPAIGAPSSVGQIYLGPFYYYLIAPFLLLSWFNPVGLAFGVSIISIAGIIASFFIVKKLVNLSVALLFTATITFSYTLIELSRFSWNPNLLPIFTFLTLYFLYAWIEQRKTLYAVLFGAFLSFAIQLHYLSLLLFFPIALYYCYTVVLSQYKKQLLIELLAAIGSFIFFTTPLIIFDLRHQFLNSKSFIKLFTEGKVAGENTYIERLGATLHAFFKFTLQIDFSQSMTWIFGIALALILLYMVFKSTSVFIRLHALTVIFFLLGFATLNSPRHFHYYGPIYTSFYLLIVYLIGTIPSKKILYLTSILFISVFCLLQIPKYHFFTQEPNNQIEYAKRVAQTFKQRIKKQPIQIVAIPTTETDGHYRYFLELEGYTLLPQEAVEQAEELYVLCFVKDCKPLDDPQWQIAAFYNKALDTSWTIENVTIYKVIHKQKP